MGLMQRLFGPRRPDDIDIRTVDWDPTPGGNQTPTHPHAATVLIDSPDSGPEVAEIKPIGVVVPRNKQELMEELRKNYADVIELVRKVNTHLDDQSSRLTEQESRGRELMEIARQIPALLATLPRLAEQNDALLALVGRLADESAGANQALRDAVSEQSQATAQSGQQLAAAIDATRTALAASVHDAADTQSRSAETVAHELGAVRAATESSAATFEAARAQLEARADDLRKAMDQHRRWSLIATVIGVVALVATAGVAVVLLLNR